MKKRDIIKNSYEFESIIKNGTCEKSKYFIIHYIDTKKNDRFGISVSKKIGNAVIRNKYKRKIRSIIDNYRKLYINYKDYIIILKKEAINVEYKKLEEDLFSLINRHREDK